jgi:hypothetical protein
MTIQKATVTWKSSSLRAEALGVMVRELGGLPAVPCVRADCPTRATERFQRRLHPLLTPKLVIPLIPNTPVQDCTRQVHPVPAMQP